MNPIIALLINILALIVGAVAGYFIHRYRIERAAKARQERAEDIVKAAQTQANMIVKGAQDNATKIIQAAESELKERRVELNRDTERLEKRRSEVDSRYDKIEQREQNRAWESY